MPADVAAGRLSLIVLSADFARVHYALVLAGAALAIGRPVTLFFTLGAAQALTGTAGRPGWASLPAVDGRRGDDVDTTYRNRGVAGFAELLAACVELGARFIVCEMALATLGLAAADLRTDVPVEIAGAVTLLAEADGTPLVI